MLLKENAGVFSPGWNWQELKLYVLPAGQSLPFYSHGENAILRSGKLEVLCKTFHNEGEIIGGSPGKDSATVVYSECVVVGYANCKVMSKPSKAEEEAGAKLPAFGTIELPKVKTELVYTGTKAQAEKEEAPVGDLFAPESGNKFVLLAFEGECPVASGTEVAVEGTTVGNFVPEANEFPVEEAHLTFPATAIKTTYKWESKGKVKEQKDGLKLFGVEPATFEALVLVKLLPDEEGNTYQLLRVGVLSA